MLVTEKKQEIINEFKKHESDTGSPEVQIAILTARITYLTEHFKTHKKWILHSKHTNSYFLSFKKQAIDL